jgi:hypothetical protein
MAKPALQLSLLACRFVIFLCCSLFSLFFLRCVSPVFLCVSTHLNATALAGVDL